MSEIVKRFFYICLLSRGPQDLPHSHALLLLSLLAYLLSGVLTLTQGMVMEQAIAAAVIDLGILLLFGRVCLQLFRKLSRYVQMMTALLGVGALFQLLALPLLASIQHEQANMELSLILLLLFSWNLAVYAHIFRESFGIRTGPAFLITLAYTVMSFAANQMIFPQAGA
ncbi:MAG: hypothetical protein EP315_01855 [Gammaproteobacteria bacterium]|nr:MAG: hypothetical protein EP315_01855 [Gammaproteobacteria bacterium]